MRVGISLPVTFSDSATSLLQTYLNSMSKSWLFSKKIVVALTSICSIFGLFIFLFSLFYFFFKPRKLLTNGTEAFITFLCIMMRNKASLNPRNCFGLV